MATASAARVRTQAIGDRLVELIRAGYSSLLVCQFGLVERLAATADLGLVLPAVMVKPEEDTYLAEGEARTGFMVQSRFRICYAEKLEAADNPLEQMTAAAATIVAALATDATLGTLRTTIGPDQVIESRPEGVEWFPQESLFFAEMQSPIRVCVIRWLVLWRNQGA